MMPNPTKVSKSLLIAPLLALAAVIGTADQARAQSPPAISANWSRLLPIEAVPTYDGLHRRGVYAWHADAHAQDLLRRAGLRVGNGPIYIGKTLGSFRERLGKHINGSVKNSSFRKALRSVLTATDDPGATRADVTRFIRAHLRVAILPIENPASIDAVEQQLIRTREPSLNQKGLRNANVKQLRKLLSAADVKLHKFLSAASVRGAMSTIAKGAGIGLLVEAPVTGVEQTLLWFNGRKTGSEAVRAGAQDVAVTGLFGLAGGVAVTAAGTVSAPVLVPIAVLGGGWYIWNSGDRIWNALDEKQKEAVIAWAPGV